jgi:RNA polymerase sigma-70 factor (ECF subfamily)
MQPVEANTLFPATEWTVVLRVRAEGDERATQEAMASLCTRYWYPLYAFARRRGLSPHDAEDRTQDFFAHALRTNLFAAAEQELGKLRTFLIVAFDRHLNRVRVHEQAQKRGGGQQAIPIDSIVGEERYAHEPVDPREPERIFERTWAMTVLQSTIQQIGVEEAEAGRAETFREFEVFLSPGAVSAGDYAGPAHRLGMSEEAFRQGVSRLRRKFRVCLRRQIAATLREPDEARVDEELAALRAALRA